MKLITRFFAEEEGADAVEYALIVALIALALVVAATALGGAIANKFTSATTQLNTAP